MGKLFVGQKNVEVDNMEIWIVTIDAQTFNSIQSKSIKWKAPDSIIEKLLFNKATKKIYGNNNDMAVVSLSRNA